MWSRDREAYLRSSTASTEGHRRSRAPFAIGRRWCGVVWATRCMRQARGRWKDWGGRPRRTCDEIHRGASTAAFRLQSPDSASAKGSFARGHKAGWRIWRNDPWGGGGGLEPVWGCPGAAHLLQGTRSLALPPVTPRTKWHRSRDRSRNSDRTDLKPAQAAALQRQAPIRGTCADERLPWQHRCFCLPSDRWRSATRRSVGFDQRARQALFFEVVRQEVA